MQHPYRINFEYVLMPLRAFVDSDLDNIHHHSPTQGRVLMPLRAFVDSDAAQELTEAANNLTVLMPLRAFVDSDPRLRKA